MRRVAFHIAMLLVPTLVVAQLPSLLNSSGVIHNSGTVKIYGDARITQDTINGRVEYLRDNADSQLVAHTTYNYLYFAGRSVKDMYDASRPVVSFGTFQTANADVEIDLIPTTWIAANGTVNHEGRINPGRYSGTVRLNGNATQDIYGKGLIPILELDNDSGAAVSRGGGLRVFHRVDLQNGELFVTPLDNLALMNDAWIWRRATGRVSDEITADTRVNLRYYGTDPILTGRELTRSRNLLADLVQDAPAGVTLTRDAWVNDSMTINAHLHTEESDTVRHSLYYTSANDPVYGALWPEINGTMIRTNLVVGRPMRMNHEYSSLSFPRSIDRGSVRRLRLRMKPSTLPLPLDDILFKNKRFMQFSALTDNDEIVTDSTYDLSMSWGWRARIDSLRETAGVIETLPQLVGREDQLVLLRYYDSTYQAYGFSRTPTNTSPDPNRIWQHSSSQFIRASGDYAIGLSTGPIWVLNGMLLLEGAMRTIGDSVPPLMATDLAQRGLLPDVPPPIYPYTLDQISIGDTAIAIGDSIVDWVTVEFRTEQFADGNPALIESLLLTRDGRLLDPQTLRPKVIAGISAGLYYLVVRHRNHLSIMTNDFVLVDRSNIRSTVDFSRGVNMLGGAASMRIVSTFGGRRFFAMPAGNTDGGLVTRSLSEGIDRNDMTLIWQNRPLINVYSIFDSNLDGVITTEDWNLSWNNRQRDNSAIPR